MHFQWWKLQWILLSCVPYFDDFDNNIDFRYIIHIECSYQNTINFLMLHLYFESNPIQYCLSTTEPNGASHLNF